MKNLIFFDVDGTIVTDNNSIRIIPESTLDALHLLRENDNLCFINSGRAMSEMDETILELEMDGFICGCGTYINYRDKVLFSKTIPFSLGNDILADLERCNLEWLLEGENAIYYSTRPYKTHIGDFKKEHMNIFPLKCVLTEPENAQNLTFDKFCICLSPDSNFEYFVSKYSETLTFIDRGNDFFEIVPKGCSKATGMQFLMDYFNIPLKNTYAIGDSTNDIPMIEFAGTGIVMGKSSPEVTKYADYITDTILNDGIYKAMKHFKLI